jgi:hypothetical protein
MYIKHKEKRFVTDTYCEGGMHVNLLGRECLVVIEGVLSAGTVIDEYRYNVVIQIPEYQRPQVVSKDNLIATLNPSAVEKLEKFLK